MDYRKYRWTRLFQHLISMPFLWAPLPFLIITDLLCELYHQICFPLYGIQKVKRSAYIQIFDRNKLAYLNFVEKLGCMYCGYANGLLLYSKEIAGRTEKYWCGIMHASKPGFKIHAQQVEQNFSKFDDQEDFKRKYM